MKLDILHVPLIWFLSYLLKRKLIFPGYQIRKI